MNFEIIDFNTHPFTETKNNICLYKEHVEMSVGKTKELYDKLGISTICGSVVESDISEGETQWDKARRNNRTALELKDIYGDFYLPGFHVHPDYVDESINEMKLMHSFGINLIGELSPADYKFDGYTSEGFITLMEEAAKLGMVMSMPTFSHDMLDDFANIRKDLICVITRTGEPVGVQRHIERMMKNENYYIDLSGGFASFRHGMLRHTIDKVGADRILFGSSFPYCTPQIVMGAVLYEPDLTDTEREKILSLNAKTILGIK